MKQEAIGSHAGHPPVHDAHARVGLAYGLAAYLAWGVIPAYFKLIAHVPPLVVLCHRVAWSVLFLAVLLVAQRQVGEVWGCLSGRGSAGGAARCRRRTLLLLVGSTAMIACNWYLFIWAVSNGRVLQASLGYFINPLVSVLLGMLVLKERLRPGQAVGLLLAAAGVAYMAQRQGALPWLSLGLAASFGLYGLLRKVAHVGPLVGLSIETTLLLPLAMAVLAGALPRLSPGGPDAAWHDYAWTTRALLAAGGVITAVPLLWFAAAARRLRLMTLGFLQYLAPTCQFLLAVFAYGEPFTRTHAVTFGLIWSALAVYSVDSLRAYRGAERRRGLGGTAVATPPPIAAAEPT